MMVHPGFQSHAGSIEAGPVVWKCLEAQSLFQSHAGSIEAILCRPCHRKGSVVSIPRWFD